MPPKPPPAFVDRLAYLRAHLPTGPIQLIGDSNISRASDVSGLLGPSVANLGVRGASSETLLENIDIFTHPAAVRVLMIGTNDIMGGASVATVASRIGEIIDTLAQTAPLIVLSPPPTAGQYGWANHRMAALSAEITKQCNARCSYLDVRSTLTDSDGFMAAAYTSDGIHLNTAGYTVLAAAISDRLELLDAQHSDCQRRHLLYLRKSAR
ncbi:GDSL-type esterase/lipase family protein [Amorphus sp. MBR-141]